MNIKDLTEQQLQELIRFTVDETLDQYFGDRDQGKEVTAAFKQNLLEIQQKRRAGRAKIPAEEVYKKYGRAANEFFSFSFFSFSRVD